MGDFYLFFPQKKIEKTRRFESLRRWGSTKDGFIHTSNIRMRPLDVNRGLCNCIFLIKMSLFLMFLGYGRH